MGHGGGAQWLAIRLRRRGTPWRAPKNSVFLLRGGVRFQDPDGAIGPQNSGEGGPRRAFTPAVAGRIRVSPERPAANK